MKATRATGMSQPSGISNGAKTRKRSFNFVLFVHAFIADVLRVVATLARWLAMCTELCFTVARFATRQTRRFVLLTWCRALLSLVLAEYQWQIASDLRVQPNVLYHRTSRLVKFGFFEFSSLVCAWMYGTSGGRSTTGRQRVLEIKPSKLHQKCPIFVGSSEDVEQVEALYRTFDSQSSSKPKLLAKL